MTLVFALYQEAKPFIEALDLRPEAHPGAGRLFVPKDPAGRHLALLITGPGPYTAAAQVAFYLGMYPEAQKYLLINIGSAAGLFTEDVPIYLCASIKDAAKQLRPFYPDILYHCPFPLANIATSASVADLKLLKSLGNSFTRTVTSCGIGNTKNPTPLPELCDMEAMGVYQGARPWMSPAQMIFLKVQSDAGVDPEEKAFFLDPVSGEPMEGSPEEHITRLFASPEITEPILAFLTGLQEYEDYALAYTFREASGYRLPDSLVRDFCCSDTMKHQLQDLLIFAAASKTNTNPAEDFIRGLYESGALPASSRKEGKKYLEQLKNHLLQ